MELIGLGQLVTGASLNTVDTPRNAAAPDRQVVAAVQALNKSQALGQDRELVYRRDPKTGSVMIQILNRGTGDVLDQIPAEVLLRMRAEFEQEMNAKPNPQDPLLA